MKVPMLSRRELCLALQRVRRASNELSVERVAGFQVNDCDDAGSIVVSTVSVNECLTMSALKMLKI